jgi:glucose-1-phosphate adenylyltransferase
MDYGNMIARHVESGADMTVGCLEVDLEMAKAFGVMGVDEEGRVMEFAEKPDEPASIPGKPDQALASMGIYVFNKEFLFEQLIKDSDMPGSSHDFGKDIIPSIIENYRIVAYPFRDPITDGQAYWRDVGTVDSYWKANLELIGITPELNLYDESWPIWTYQAQLPPAKFVFDDDDRRGMAVDAMVSGGCIISGSIIRHSLLFSNVHVHSYSVIEDSVILPDVVIERECRIKNAVIDKGCVIPRGTVIGEDPEEDAKRFYVSEKGIVLVTPEMLGIRNRYVR